MSDGKPFEREYRDRASWDKFFKQFIKNTQIKHTYKEAYKLTEKQHRQTYGQNCYATYNSFRNVKTRKLK